MHKKNSSKPRVVGTIKIDISSDPKCSVKGSNNVYTCFHRISQWHLPESYAAVNFNTFELVIVFVIVFNDVIIM